MTDVCTFRLDDITPDMDWNRFYRVKAIFDKYKVKPLIGVVPDNQDPGLKKGEYHADFWDYICCLQKEGWSIAQHGYQHVYETKDSGLLGLKDASEFAGLSYEAQYGKLKAGQKILHNAGLDVTIFMAPGHTFDKKTLKALRKLNFTCVTDGYTGLPYESRGLLFVPCRSSRPRLTKGVDTICCHCNEMEDNNYLELERFLEKNSAQVVSFSEITDQLWYPRKNLPLKLQEKKNLLLVQVKKRVAGSNALREYLQQTYDEDAGKKRKKRIFGLWRLLLHK